MEITFDFACQDDCLDKMVPSDLRQVVSEREQLRSRAAMLEKERDELRARVAELNTCINHAFHIASVKPQDYAIMMALNNNASKAWLLRQRAEAVDELNCKLTEIAEDCEGRLMNSTLVMQYAASCAGEEAQRLRQAADEVEKEDREKQWPDLDLPPINLWNVPRGQR